jgi:putative transcriptional regulator
MPKVRSKAYQARLNYQARVGRRVSLRDVEEATGITQAALSRIESGKTERIDFDTLAKLCTFYGVGVGELLEYDPNGIKTPGFEAQPLGV